MKLNKRKSPLDIKSGGKAIKVKKDTYLMKGNKHKDGGIKIGPNNKKGLEVEDREVIKLDKNNTAKVYSAQPIINGESPANKILKGENSNIIFNKQEQYKNRNNLKDDGSKAKYGTIVNINGNVKNGLKYNSPLRGNRNKALLGTGFTFKGANTTFNPRLKDILPSDETNKKRNNFLNNLTTEDYIATGSNLLGSVADYGLTNKAINKQKSPRIPVRERAAKLKTNYNINPQLDNIQETYTKAADRIGRNTSSSSTALAREQRLLNDAGYSKNELYGQKENIETDLINRDRTNQQEVGNRNVRSYNEYTDRKINFENAKTMAKAENSSSLIGNINENLQGTLSKEEDRRRFNKSVEAMQSGFPNVDARIFKNVYESLNKQDKTNRRIGGFTRKRKTNKK